MNKVSWVILTVLLLAAVGVGGYFLGQRADQADSAELPTLTDAEMAWCLPNSVEMVLTMDGLGYFDEGFAEDYSGYEGARPGVLRSFFEQVSYVGDPGPREMEFTLEPHGRASYEAAKSQAVLDAQLLVDHWIFGVLEADLKSETLRNHPDVVRVCRAAYEAFR